MKNRYLLYIDGLLSNTNFGLRKMIIELDCTVEEYEKYLQSLDKSVKIAFSYKL